LSSEGGLPAAFFLFQSSVTSAGLFPIGAKPEDSHPRPKDTKNMKTIIPLAALALALAGCATQRGATGNAYETEYGPGWNAETAYYPPAGTIYPVRRQPSIYGDDPGDPHPMIDPARQWDLWEPNYGTKPAPRHEIIVHSEPSVPQARQTSPRDPIFNQ